MKNKSVIKWLTLGLMIFSLASCMKDDFIESKSDAVIKLDKSNIPTGYKLGAFSVKLKESNTGAEISLALDGSVDSAVTNLNYGTYSASLEGEVEIIDNGVTKKMKANARLESIVVNANKTAISLKLFLSDPTAQFVFKEIFFTGTRTPENKAYNGDKYFIIQNNSNDTLYADGLLIAQSTFLTTTKREYTPDVMNEAFTTQQIIMIPGDGDDYPVLPGAQFVIANNAINHTEANSNSFDLSKADVEIELLSSINVDNPNVPNTISVAGTMIMHDRGFTSYVLGRLPASETIESYKEKNAYTCTYIGTIGRVMTVNAYKFPNSYVQDAVNLSVEEGYEWLVTSPSLDMGWSFCGKTSSDANRYGKAVARKSYGQTSDGKSLLQDTNNSANDFNAEVAPSLKK